MFERELSINLYYRKCIIANYIICSFMGFCSLALGMYQIIFTLNLEVEIEVKADEDK